MMNDFVTSMMDESVVTFVNDEVSAVRDDVLEGGDVVFDTDGYNFPEFVDTHSHTSIHPGEGNHMYADPVAVSKRGGRQ